MMILPVMICRQSFCPERREWSEKKDNSSDIAGRNVMCVVFGL